MKQIFIFLVVLLPFLAKSQTVIYGKYKYTDSLTFAKYKNSSTLDSVLSVDQNGRLRLAPASGLDTTSLSNRIDARVKYTDTSSMLIPYLRKLDTTGKWLAVGYLPYLVKYTDTAAFLSAYYNKTVIDSKLALKLNISDTAAMLSPYARTANLPSLAPYVKYTDTSTMLSPYYRTANATAALALKLNISDTATMLSSYYNKTTVDSKVNLKVNISDTLSMLSPYQRSFLAVKYTDTASMLSNYRTNINSLISDSVYQAAQILLRVRYTDTSTMLSPYARTLSLGGYVPYSGATNDLNIGTHNLYANNFFDGFTNIAASGTQIVLTTASTPSYTITGSGGQTIKLPDATTLPNGAIFSFNNNQTTGAITINNNSNTLIISVPSGGFAEVYLLDNSIAAGSWDRHFQAPSNVSWSTNTFDYAGSITSATWNGVAVAVNRGGTGASTSGGALTNLGAQPQLNGTGFVKASGTTISYDNSTYLTTSSASSTYLPLGGGTMTGNLILNADPTNSLGAVTKNYVDNAITGIFWKSAVKAATTGNITLLGAQTIDGVSIVANDRVLVKNQSTATQNGIYLASTTIWTRTTDADTGGEIYGSAVFVENGGSINGGTQWTNSNTSQPTIGVDNISFSQIAGAGVYTAGTYLSLTGNVFDVNSTYSSNWNNKINPSDTATMLTPYLHSVNYGLIKSSQTVSADSSLLSTKLWRQKGIDSVAALDALKVKYTDTATMLSAYYNKTASDAKFNLKVNISDTASMLSGYKTYYPRAAISLTVTGSSGASSYSNSTGVLNVPTYSLSGLGGEPAITAGTTSQYWRGDKTWQTLDKTAVGLSNVTNNAQVTSVTGTSPIASSGGTTPAISITQANTTTSGYLSSTDWNTFNGKQNTLVAADATHDGYLTSANWVTFNAKQSAITLTTTGSSGASTFSSNTLNVPNYTLSGLGGQPQLNGTGFVKATGTTISYDNSTYLTGNQTITLSGDISGSGATAITTTIGALKVTNAMLAGTINYSKMDATTVPIWNQSTTGTASYANVLNVYSNNEATIANGWAVVGGGDLYINYRGATGVGITGYIMANGLSTGTQVPVKASSFIGGGSALTSLPTNTALYPTLNQSTTGTAANITATSNATLTTLSALSLPYSQLTGTPSIPSVSGTTNYLPKFTGTSTIGNSAITDDGTTVTLVSRALSGVSATFSGVVTLNSNEPLILNRANNTSTSNAIRFQTGGATQWYVGSDSYLQSGTENFGFYNFAYRLIITPSGNLGLGVTPSAWYSGYVALEMGSGSLVYPANGSNTQLWNNLYVNAAGNVTYKSTGIGGLFSLGGGGNTAVWYSAPSGTSGTTASLTQAMTLFSSGGLGLGTTTDAGYKLDVNGTGRFSGALTGTNATFTAANGISQVFAKVIGSTVGNYAEIALGNDTYVNSAIRSYSDNATNYTGHLEFSNFNAGTRVPFLTTTAAGAATFSAGVSIGGAFGFPNGSISTYGELAFNSSALNIYTYGRIGLANAGRIIYNNGTGSNLFFGEIASNIYGFTAGGYNSTPGLTMDMANYRVGIGTSSPNGNAATTNLLHINGSTSNAEIHLTNSSTGTTGTDGLTILQYGTQSVLFNLENDAMLFGTNNTERMRITSGGVVQIANASGTLGTIVGSERLNVNGDVYAYGNLIVSGATFGGTTTQAYGYGHIYKGYTGSYYDVMFLNSGIAVDELTVSGGLNFTTTTAGVTFPNMTTTQKNALTKRKGMVVYDTTANLLQCWNGASWNNLW